MVNQTKKLIKKLKLKPKYHESQYSQTFIKRERDICSQIMNQTNIRIDQKTPAYLKQKNRMSAFKAEVIYKKLGLFKKLTEEERMMALSIQAVEKKKKRQEDAAKKQQEQALIDAEREKKEKEKPSIAVIQLRESDDSSSDMDVNNDI